MVSPKQLLANQQNALKSTGPKTAKGKALAASNSLRHGLLAKEVVITEGEGAEDQQAFDALMTDLVEQFEPVGSLEEILVEKIAVCYWRLRRANRYEVGVLRQKLDTVTNDYYGAYNKETDAEIDEQIEEKNDQIKAWQGDLKELKKSVKNGDDFSAIIDWEKNWEWLYDKYYYLFNDDDYSSENVRKTLNSNDISNDQIWQKHIDLCQEHIDANRQGIERLQKSKVKNKLRLQVNKKCRLPPKLEMDNLLRYETAIERQLYKAINQLERLQRIRAGDHVPAPVQVDLNIADLNTRA